MATYSHSPRIRAVDPATPVHSPHHSVHSSVSSRLSVRNLTLHEYRKQQNSPASQATPPGRTLRRKAAASGLKEIERVPSASRTPLSSARVPPRPLHLSQSTHSLFTYQQLPPSPPHQDDLSVDELFRSQSADPSALRNPIGKVREFKPIKRLPKPLSSQGRGPLPISPAPLASVTSNQSHLSPLRTTSFPSFETSTPNDDSQPTPSSFSLSRFPQPPNWVDPSQSPPADEDEPPHVNTVSFISTAPATPPATPAVIHYRGASFDLVNPHNSLVLDNIVTPSRDLDSSDYLPLRSSEDPLDLSEMAPKRPLYGDLSSAYASIITRRGDEHSPQLNVDLPLPPTPVAQSPGSSAFDSPMLSPQSYDAAVPFTDKQPANDSRFSLKQLTRSLTQRFSKVPEQPHEEELQEFSESRVSLASASFEGEFPRPLERSYRAVTPKSSPFSDEPLTPISPLDQVVHIMNQRSSPGTIEQSQNAQRVFSAPLASMVPDDPSIEMGRGDNQRLYTSDSNFSGRPYYDELSSIYPSSSLYTNESRRQSIITQGCASNRKSNPYYWRMTGDAETLANEYKSYSLPQYPNSQRGSQHVPTPPGQSHRSVHLEIENADTISKFIGRYERHDSSNASQPLFRKSDLGDSNQEIPVSNPDEDTGRTERTNTNLTSALDHFQFGLSDTASYVNGKFHNTSIEVGRAEPSKLASHPGAPPSVPAPLAPAFRYHEEDFDSPKHSGLSEMSFKSPSYGDTRQLLQMSSQPVVDYDTSMQPEPPSSSHYSQPGASSTPEKALEQAEEIFAAAANQQSRGIPAMWSKRISSHNLLRNTSSNESKNEDAEQEELEDSSGLMMYEDEADPADWETVGNVSPRQALRVSIGESLADYSSSEGTHSSRDSMGFSGSFPVYEEPPMEPGTFQYRHPLPLRNHSNPFTSSPPQLPVGGSMPGMVLDGYGTPLHLSPLASSTVPAFSGRSPDMSGSRSSPRSDYIPFTPWATPYNMSEKETQELLASGPNDEILYDEDEGGRSQDPSSEPQSGSYSTQPMFVNMPTATIMDGGNGTPNLPRENTFEKLTLVGPRGNLTGTPHGTGMHDAGSSVADNSSPGAILDSSSQASPTRGLTGYHIFRSAAARNANMQPRGHASPDVQEGTPSQDGSSPREAPFSGHDRRARGATVQYPSTPRDPRRRGSRAAVPGQTKLRQMVLAPSAQTLSLSERSIDDSRLFGTDHSARPSTSNTNTPLRHPTSRPALRGVFANEHSPHLLCPERAIDPEEEEARRKLSWMIFAIFCILPPMLILYRWMGDTVIVNVTKGRFSQVSPKPKRMALGMGIAVNITICGAILLPILIAHAAGSL